MVNFVFCHGLGFDVNFWGNLAPFFSQEKCSFIDLGYFSNPLSYQALHAEKVVAIGHSIGLSKLLLICDNIDYLIGLNGFINFLGYQESLRRRRQKELNALRASFIKAPTDTMKMFYTRCGLHELIDRTNFSHLEHDLILSELSWLQQEFEPPKLPTLILSSDDDVIVPQTIIADNFSAQPNVKFATIIGAKHAIGFQKPAEVYEKFMSFLNDSTT